jgi:hypothetical protein
LIFIQHGSVSRTEEPDALLWSLPEELILSLRSLYHDTYNGCQYVQIQFVNIVVK